MTWFGENSYYFDQLREFVPQDALTILERQKEKVSQAIEKQVEQFGRALADHVKRDVEKAQLEAQAALGEARTNVEELLARFKGELLDAAKIGKLEKALDDYEHKWRSLGEKVADAAKAAIKTSTGLSI